MPFPGAIVTHKLSAMPMDLDTRLSQTEGQVRALREMVAEGRDCADLLMHVNQLRGRLRAIAVQLVQDHARTCMAGVEDENLRRRHLQVVRRFSRV